MTRLAGGGSASGVESGIVDGTGSVAMFYFPFGVAVSTSGTVYVAEWSTHLIRTISLTGTTFAQITQYSFIGLWHGRCGDEVGWWRKCWWCC